MSRATPGPGHDDPLDPVETEESGVAHRLRTARPHPAPDFRDSIRSSLVSGSPTDETAGREPTRRGSPIPLICGYLAGGVILLLVAMAGIAGVGPFAS